MNFSDFIISQDCAQNIGKRRGLCARYYRTLSTVREDGGLILKFDRVSLANARGEGVSGYKSRRI